MTPYGKAKALLTELKTFAAARDTPVKLPSEAYAQMGGQVVACEGLIVALARVSPAEGIDPTCGAIQLGDFIISLARSCSVVFDDTGADDVDEVKRVSEETDIDLELLWDFADSLSVWGSKTWSVTNTLLGGLSITTLSLTAGID